MGRCPAAAIDLIACLLLRRFTRTHAATSIDTLAEWSKAVDSSSTIFGCVGSNPTGVILSSSYPLGRTSPHSWSHWAGRAAWEQHVVPAMRSCAKGRAARQQHVVAALRFGAKGRAARRQHVVAALRSGARGRSARQQHVVADLASHRPTESSRRREQIRGTSRGPDTAA